MNGHFHNYTTAQYWLRVPLSPQEGMSLAQSRTSLLMCLYPWACLTLSHTISSLMVSLSIGIGLCLCLPIVRALPQLHDGTVLAPRAPLSPGGYVMLFKSKNDTYMHVCVRVCLSLSLSLSLRGRHVLIFSPSLSICLCLCLPMVRALPQLHDRTVLAPCAPLSPGGYVALKTPEGLHTISSLFASLSTDICLCLCLPIVRALPQLRKNTLNSLLENT